MSALLRLVLFAVVSAAANVYAGWWAVPLAAAVWVRVFPSGRRPVRTTALGAALGCAALLGWRAIHGPALALATQMSAVLSLPRWGFLAATLIYPALLAGAAALMLRPSRR
jgi:hypothetical protein